MRIDLALQQSVEIAATADFGQEGGRREVYDSLKRITGRLRFLEAIWIGDSEGWALATTLSHPPPRASAADRVRRSAIVSPARAS